MDTPKLSINKEILTNISEVVGCFLNSKKDLRGEGSSNKIPVTGEEKIEVINEDDEKILDDRFAVIRIGKKVNEKVSKPLDLTEITFEHVYYAIDFGNNTTCYLLPKHLVSKSNKSKEKFIMLGEIVSIALAMRHYIGDNEEVRMKPIDTLLAETRKCFEENLKDIAKGKKTVDDMFAPLFILVNTDKKRAIKGAHIGRKDQSESTKEPPKRQALPLPSKQKQEVDQKADTVKRAMTSTLKKKKETEDDSSFSMIDEEKPPKQMAKRTGVVPSSSGASSSSEASSSSGSSDEATSVEKKYETELIARKKSAAALFKKATSCVNQAKNIGSQSDLLARIKKSTPLGKEKSKSKPSEKEAASGVARTIYDIFGLNPGDTTLIEPVDRVSLLVHSAEAGEELPQKMVGAVISNMEKKLKDEELYQSLMHPLPAHSSGKDGRLMTAYVYLATLLVRKDRKVYEEMFDELRGNFEAVISTLRDAVKTANTDIAGLYETIVKFDRDLRNAAVAHDEAMEKVKKMRKEKLHLEQSIIPTLEQKNEDLEKALAQLKKDLQEARTDVQSSKKSAPENKKRKRDDDDSEEEVTRSVSTLSKLQKDIVQEPTVGKKRASNKKKATKEEEEEETNGFSMIDDKSEEKNGSDEDEREEESEDEFSML